MPKAEMLAYNDWFKSKMCDKDKCPSDSTLKTYAYSMAWLQQRIEGFVL